MAQVFQVFTIRDEKAQAFTVPMYFPTKGVALRSLSAAVNKPNSDDLYSTHPQDFGLYHIGTYDADTGLHEPVLPSLVNMLSDLAE